MTRFRYLSSILVAASLACFVPSLGAQAAPGVIRSPAVNKAFPANQHLMQVYADQLPGDAPGAFTCCLSFQTSPTSPPDVVIGHYDQTRGTFTPTTEANALNTTTLGEFGLALEPRLGRYAVFAQAANPNSPMKHFFAQRARAGLPFAAPVQISGVPASTFQTALGYVDGKLELFYPRSDQKALVMHDLDITNPKAPKLTGTAQVVAVPTASNRYVTPLSTITGPDGDVEGLLFSEGTRGIPDAQLVFQAGLDPKRPGMVVVPDCGAGCAPAYATVAGGRILFRGFRQNAANAIHDVEVAWILGDVVKPGGTADIVGAVSPSPNAITLVMLSNGVTQQIKLPSPLDVGFFALDSSSTFLLGALTHNDASQRGRMSFPVPNDPRLTGVRAAVQGLSFDSNARPLAWTNTAWLDVR